MAAVKPEGMRNQDGFTLIELLLVLALLLVAVSGIYQLFYFSQGSYDSASAESGIAQEARLFVMRLEREVRNARQAVLSTNPVTVPDGITPAGSRINIYTDVNGDGRPELVAYRLNGGALQRAVMQRNARTPDAFPYTFNDPAESDWQTVLTRVTEVTREDGTNEPIFSIDDNPPRSFPRALVNVQLNVRDPVRVNTVRVLLDIGIRSQEAAQ